MAVFPGFNGPSNRLRSITVDAERSINLYCEQSGAGSPKGDPALYPTPGFNVFAFLGTGPVRAVFAQDGRCFGVGGAAFYEVLPSGLVLPWGIVAVDGNPATISSNGDQGHQLFITSGRLGYIFDLVSSAFTQIVDAAFPSNALQGLFFDGYFIVLDGDNGRFLISSLYDGLDWNGTDFGLESQFSDRIVAMTRTHDNLWLFGTKNTAPWYNSGNANFPFQPVPSSLIEHGTAAAFACVEIDNGPMWLGADEQGQGMVWRANGYTPVRASTHAIEYLLLPFTNLSGARAWAYQEQGHTFYVLNVPGLDTTPVYDIATQQWHERAHWDSRFENWIPYLGINHCLFQGLHLVGDRQSGAIYKQSLEITTDRLVIGA